MKRLLSLIAAFPILLLLLCTSAHGQTTYPAASCNLAAVQAAITAELATPVDGDIITIPAGSCIWAGSTLISVTFTHSVTIQGAGAVSATTSGASTVGSDLTTITDNTAGAGSPITISTTAGKSFRLTGIFFNVNGSSTAKSDGLVKIVGSSTAIRADHLHCFLNGISGICLFFADVVNGVADHNFMDNPADSVTNDYVFHGNGFGDLEWNQADQWGSSNFIFVEDNRFHNGGLGDGSWGGRYVIRHSTCVADNTSGVGDCQMYNHGITPGTQRSLRLAEVYSNTFAIPGSPGVNHPAWSINGGTLLFWGNTVTQFRQAVQLDYTRKSDNPPNYVYQAPPTGWGHCDGAGVFTAWDTVPACFDGTGRGQGDLLSGSLPTVCNITTNPGCNIFTGQAVHQALSPVYVWNNAYTPASGYSGGALVGVSASQIVNNRDYYQDFGPNANPGSFNGTVGIGQGLLAARPATCTTGVGYWATDVGANGTLYACGPTNTWSVYYTPFTYPHPGAGGGGVPSMGCSPNPVAFGNQNINTSSSITCTLTNSGSATQTYSSITVSPSMFVNGNTGLAGQCPASGTIATGASCTVKVTFTPTAVQSYSGTLSMTGTVNLSVSLSGAGTNAISIPAVPTGLSAGVAGANVTLTWPASTGTPTGYNVLRSTVSGGPYSNIATLGLATSFVDNARPNGTYFYVVNAFNSAGTSANSTQASATVSTACGINLSPSSLSLGFATLGTTVTSNIAFTVANVGTATCTSLVVADPSGPNGPDFGMGTNCGTLIVGGTCSITPLFTPSIVGLEQAAIVVSSTDPTGPHTVSLTGTGVESVTILPTPLNFGNVYTKKSSSTRSATYTNSSGVTVTFSSIAIDVGDTTQFSIDNTVVGRCNGTVINGASCTVNAIFNPSTPGTKNATLHIVDTAGTHAITLTGSGRSHKFVPVL